MPQHLLQLLALPAQPDPGLGWHACIEAGFDVAAFKNLAKALQVPEKRLGELMRPEGPVPRKGTLTRGDSNFLFRVASALAALYKNGKDERQAALWLREPHDVFKGRIPLLLLQSHHATQYVMTLIAREAPTRA